MGRGGGGGPFRREEKPWAEDHDRGVHGGGEVVCIFKIAQSWFKVPAEPWATHVTLQSPLSSELWFALCQIGLIKSTCRLL